MVLDRNLKFILRLCFLFGLSLCVNAASYSSGNGTYRTNFCICQLDTFLFAVRMQLATGKPVSPTPTTTTPGPTTTNTASTTTTPAKTTTNTGTTTKFTGSTTTAGPTTTNTATTTKFTGSTTTAGPTTTNTGTTTKSATIGPTTGNTGTTSITTGPTTTNTGTTTTKTSTLVAGKRRKRQAGASSTTAGSVSTAAASGTTAAAASGTTAAAASGTTVAAASGTTAAAATGTTKAAASGTTAAAATGTTAAAAAGTGTTTKATTKAASATGTAGPTFTPITLGAARDYIAGIATPTFGVIFNSSVKLVDDYGVIFDANYTPSLCNCTIGQTVEIGMCLLNVPFITAYSDINSSSSNDIVGKLLPWMDQIMISSFQSSGLYIRTLPIRFQSYENTTTQLFTRVDLRNTTYKPDFYVNNAIYKALNAVLPPATIKGYDTDRDRANCLSVVDVTPVQPVVLPPLYYLRYIAIPAALGVLALMIFCTCCGKKDKFYVRFW